MLLSVSLLQETWHWQWQPTVYRVIIKYLDNVPVTLIAAICSADGPPLGASFLAGGPSPGTKLQ